MAITVIPAVSSEHLDHVRALFREYARWLDSGHLCLGSFEREVVGLPGEYGPPRGCLLLAVCDGQIAGCVGLRPLDEGTCEMKRFYVRPQFRGRGVGRALADAVMAEARRLGYRRMRLDTIADRMPEAVALYRMLGFREIPVYRPDPLAHSLCMELEL